MRNTTTRTATQPQTSAADAPTRVIIEAREFTLVATSLGKGRIRAEARSTQPKRHGWRETPRSASMTGTPEQVANLAHNLRARFGPRPACTCTPPPIPTIEAAFTELWQPDLTPGLDPRRGGTGRRLYGNIRALESWREIALKLAQRARDRVRFETEREHECLDACPSQRWDCWTEQIFGWAPYRPAHKGRWEHTGGMCQRRNRGPEARYYPFRTTGQPITTRRGFIFALREFAEQIDGMESGKPHIAAPRARRAPNPLRYRQRAEIPPVAGRSQGPISLPAAARHITDPKSDAQASFHPIETPDPEQHWRIVLNQESKSYFFAGPPEQLKRFEPRVWTADLRPAEFASLYRRAVAALCRKPRRLLAGVAARNCTAVPAERPGQNGTLFT